ncbi:DUF190 domain-containing protein [Kushneria phyllosphaerae]|uniref:Uncharacterized protein n=1 Tax=Kushneria phyllosphaerae TaxID=2100822 RepID=A0A2R8CHU7_9GAMM|nr:DUF190 domain-containing protein [Kushneria phyllosphaerae]SPJ32467.1 hypothetical protein KSP9073_00467 [Kushneria phyllosphaerae]
MNRLKSGYEVIFIVTESSRYNGKRIYDLVTETAGELGITRMTRRSDVEGVGEDGRLHSAHFFELADQPIELMYAMGEEEADRFITAVEDTGAPVFCICRPVHFGQLNEQGG